MTVAARVRAGVTWMSLGNVATRSLGILALPLLTRWLTPANYGVAALASTIMSFAAALAILGLDSSYARCYHDPEMADRETIESLCWRLAAAMGTAIAILTWLIWNGAREWVGGTEIPGWMIGAGVLFSVLATMAQMRARLRAQYRRLAVVLWLSSAGAVSISLLLAYQLRGSSWPLVAAAVAGFLLPVVFLGVPRALLVNKRKVSRATARRIVTTALAGALTTPMFMLLSSGDRWLLAFLADTREVGIYAVAFSVGTLGMVLNTAAASVWVGEVSKLQGENGEVAAESAGVAATQIGGAMLIVWLAVSAAGGDVIRLFADRRFHEAAEFVPWLATGTLFYGWSHIARSPLLIADRLAWASIAATLGTLASLALNLVLIPDLGGEGAAIVQAAGFFLVAVMMWTAVLRHWKINIRWIRLGIASATVAVVGFYCAPAWNINPLASLAEKFPLCAGTALISWWLIAPAHFRRSIIRR